MNRTHSMLLLSVLLTVSTVSVFAQSTNSLPVSLTMDASLTGEDKVTIAWTMLAKLNTDCFDVERSNDGISWRSIATIRAKDSISIPFTYTILDPSPLKGINYYKLRLKDLGGIYTYTPVKNVRVNTMGRVSIYPNPSSTNVNVILAEVPQSDWGLSVINSQGQVVVQKKYAKNITAVILPVASYAAGNYTVQITEGNAGQSNKLMIMHY